MEMTIVDFTTGVFAFFINDFLYPEAKISDFKLFLDSISVEFVSEVEPSAMQ